MNRKTRHLMVGGVLLLTVAAGFCAWHRRSREPAYQGRPLEFWVRETGNLQNERDARKAIKTIGAPAVPFLVREAAAEESLRRRAYRVLWPILPDVVQRKLPKPWTRLEGITRVAWAYAEIGTAAIPALMSLLNDRESGVRINALIALSRMRANRTPAVPMLIRALTNNDTGLTPGNPWPAAEIQRLAVTVLGQVGPGAGAAVPELTKLRSSTNAFTRAQATVALWRITGEAAYVQFLISDLEQGDDPETIRQTLNGLGDIGSAAIVALPAIRKKFHGQTLSGDLLDTVLRIDPDAIFRSTPFPKPF